MQCDLRLPDETPPPPRKASDDGAFDAAAFAAKLPPPVRLAFDYWNAKRAGRPMPARRDIDPLEMRAFLPKVMLLQTLDGGRDFFCRVVGSDIRDSLGLELTARRLSELQGVQGGAHALRRLQGDCRDLVLTRRPSFVRHETTDPFTGRRRPYEQLLTPLSEDGVAVTMLLGLRRDFGEPRPFRRR